jgi:hypothetical protein
LPSQYRIRSQLLLIKKEEKIHSCQYIHIGSSAIGYKCILFDYIILYIYRLSPFS